MADLIITNLDDESKFKPLNILHANDLNMTFIQPLMSTKSLLTVLTPYFSNYNNDEEDTSIDFKRTPYLTIESLIETCITGLTKAKNKSNNEAGLYISKDTNDNVSASLKHLTSTQETGLFLGDTENSLKIQLSNNDYSKIMIRKNPNSATPYSQILYESKKNGTTRNFDFDKVSDLLNNNNYIVSNSSDEITIFAPTNKIPQIKFVNANGDYNYWGYNQVSKDTTVYFCQMTLENKSGSQWTDWNGYEFQNININFLVGANSNSDLETIATTSGISQRLTLEVWRKILSNFKNFPYHNNEPEFTFPCEGQGLHKYDGAGVYSNINGIIFGILNDDNSGYLSLRMLSIPEAGLRIISKSYQDIANDSNAKYFLIRMN